MEPPPWKKPDAPHSEEPGASTEGGSGAKPRVPAPGGRASPSGAPGPSRELTPLEDGTADTDPISDEDILDISLDPDAFPSAPPPNPHPSLPPAAGRRRRPSLMPAIAPFGRYELLGRIAYGGMAEIFLARERTQGTNRHVVIKRIMPHVADDPNFVHMFLDEARLATLLFHPNICHIYEFGQEAGTYFIAMEWINGISLGKLIRQSRVHGGIPYPIGVKLISTIAGALSYAHRARDPQGEPLGIVHRDVSPQNIMVSYDGTVKLLDFGIAKASTQASRTQAGVVKGKFAYMSPQQCLGKPVDPRADIFSLGVCLFEVLTGRGLYHRKTEYETMRAVVEKPPPSLKKHMPDLPDALDSIVKRALAKEPDDRFPDADAMHQALERCLAQEGEVVTSVTVESFLADVYGEDARLGPQVDSTPFGSSLQVDGLPEAPSGLGHHLSSAPSSAAPSAPAPGKSPRLRKAAAIVGLLAAAAVGTTLALVLTQGMDAPAPAPTGPEVGAATPEGPAPATPEPDVEAEEVEDVQAVEEAPTPPPAAEATSGSATIMTEPAGANVVIDGTPHPEITPVQLDELALGSHEVEISLPGYRTHKGTLEVTGEERAELVVELTPVRRAAVRPKGSLSINTRPWSKVYLGGRLLGTTPIGSARVPSGTVRLRLVDRDGQTHHRTVKVNTSGESRVFYDLTK